MFKSNHYLLALTMTAALGLAAGDAHAGRKERERLAETQITLVQAITTAETHHGGRAYEAELEGDSFTPEYEVKILKDGKEFEVTVDGVSGEVKRVREDK